MNRIIGACGVVCTECDAYKATQSNDAEAIAKTAAEAGRALGVTIPVEQVWCDGCLTSSARKCYHCAECNVRACVLSRGLANCAECADYACDMVTEVFRMAPSARETLDEIRAAGSP